MALPSPAGAHYRLKEGSALIIVLLFVILITVVTVALLSRSMTAMRVSTSSAGETKAAILANGAADIVIGDLRQEIIAGSGTLTPPSPVPTIQWPVYTPNSNQTMVPFQNGIPSPNTTIPNLIARSVSPSNTGGPAPYAAYPNSSTTYAATLVPPARAATDASATAETTSNFASVKVNSAAPSLNGRSVSLAQWNEPYLMSASQLGKFIPPDWVIVTRAGAASVGWSSGGTSGLNVSTPSNTNYAIGRYAYAIYDEGGLLDMNVAGFPSGLTTAQSSNKSSVALADLTQIGLTQPQIDNIVGWRNYASAELTGSYGSFSPFTPAAASNWMTNFVLGNTNGYMQITPPPTGVTTPPTDQAFVSRQQLISLTQSLGVNTDALQYMGTFSRALEQPSFIPDPGRPAIVAAGSPPPAYNLCDSYKGNNDGQGGDSTINPTFLAMRSVGGYNHLNGTPAVAGEPLAKYRFPLSSLALVAYNATNASVQTSNGTSSDPDPIYDRFGLKRTNPYGPWVYNHNPGAARILTLAQVRILKRDPDFAELLKAAISAGALAKGGPNLNLSFSPPPYNFQYASDTSLDTAVIQIMANLIDQQDADSYPTVISIGTNTAYGVEDLPYFYRYHLLGVVDRLPVPNFSKGSSITFPPPASGITTTGSLTGPSMAVNYQTGATQAASWTCTWSFKSGTPQVTYTEPVTINSIKQTTLSDAGEAVLMYVADLWNPHDANTLASSSSNRPTQFRVYATTDDPVAGTPAWDIGAESQFSGSGNDTTKLTATYSGVVPQTDSTNYWYNWRIAPTQSLTLANSAMTFNDDNGKLFREPTLLWNNNPTGLSLTPAAGATMAGAVVDVNTSQSYTGFIIGKAPISFQFTLSSANAATGASSPQAGIDGTYVVQGTTLVSLPLSPAGSFKQISFFLQYLDPSGNWVTYDVKYPDLHGLSPPSIIADPTDDYATSYMNPLADNQFSDSATGFDPRSARWGVGTGSNLGQVSPGTNGHGTTSSPYLLEPLANSNFGNNTKLGGIKFSVLESNRPRADKGDQTNYSNPGMTSDTNGGSNPQMRLYSGNGFSASNGNAGDPLEYDGLMSQNYSVLAYDSKGSSNPPVAPTPGQHFYFEDCDGVDRRAMGAYADTTMIDDGTPANTALAVSSTKRIGLPEATANTLDNNGVATPASQSQSRPLILNRPFRSVAEMSYAFSGTPWRNIDFFTPESGYSALLDTFCINQSPANALVAGKVDLNTRNAGVIQALVSGAYVDEVANSSASPPNYALPPLTSTDAGNAANMLLGITTDSTHTWRGPLANVSWLAGHFIANPGTTTGYTDLYTYAPPAKTTAVSGASLTSVTYAGLSAALDGTVYTANPSTIPVIQRFRESAIRPLAAAGQVRVWNLLIDLVAQTGHYPKTATALDQFVVEGQKHLWVHVAIDRLTGQVLDRQVEVVTQ